MAEDKKVEFGHAKPHTIDVHMAVEQVCPIHGVRIGRWADRSTWSIDFKDEATPAQRKAAQQILLAFTWEEKHPDYVGAPNVVR